MADAMLILACTDWQPINKTAAKIQLCCTQLNKNYLLCIDMRWWFFRNVLVLT